MRETRYFYVPNATSRQDLPDEEAVHALRVLRLEAGDELFLMDGQGTFYRALVTLTTAKKCMYEICEVLSQTKTWGGHIHLAIAPTKMMERMEWMVEKATEIGFDEISFLQTQFSERKIMKTARLERIIVSAVKQSRKPWMPRVNQMTSFLEFIYQPCEGLKYIAHCYDEIAKEDLFSDLVQISKNEPVTVLIGPEGDFSLEEVRTAMAMGYKSITLGNSRLRTETAGLMAVAMAQLAKRL